MPSLYKPTQIPPKSRILSGIKKEASHADRKRRGRRIGKVSHADRKRRGRQGKILKVMIIFEEIWMLLNPQGEFKRRRGACERLWQGYEAARQEAIYKKIAGKLQHGEFVNQNPYFAIEDNAMEAMPRREILSFNDYYQRFGTTEEQGGWKMANPTGQKVIYVKSG